MGKGSRRGLLAVEAIGLRVALDRLLRRRPLPEVLRAITPRDRFAVPAPLDEVERALAASERWAVRLRFVPNTCLYRAMARYAVLRRAGHPARFVMGLRPGDAEINGHAWVELGGAPAFEALEERLAVTFSYPDPERATP
jgi:hypothetical protein